MKTFTAICVLATFTVTADARPPQAPRPAQAPPTLAGCDCAVTGVCDCGPSCNCAAVSSYGNTVRFRRNTAGELVPDGQGWRREGGYWVRDLAPVYAPPPVFLQPAPFSTSMNWGGGFRGGACAGGS